MTEFEENLENVRNELRELVENYQKLIEEVPVVKIDSADYNLENVITNLKDNEDELRKSGENIVEIFQTTQKMLELMVNSNILNQHFVGCLNVAASCEDLMCFKIFMSQAFTAYLQQLSFIKKFLELYEEVNLEDLIKQLRLFEDNIEILKKYNSNSQPFLDKMEKMVQELNDITKELPSGLY